MKGRLTAKKLLKEVQELQYKSGSAQRQLYQLQGVAEALSTLRYRAEVLDGREVAKLQKSLEEYAKHLNAEIKRLKGGANAEKFLKMVEKKVNSFAKDHNYLTSSSSYRVDSTNPENPRITFNYGMTTEKGYSYNLERDEKGWVKRFSWTMDAWAKKQGVKGNLWTHIVQRGLYAQLSIPVPKELK